VLNDRRAAHVTPFTMHEYLDQHGMGVLTADAKDKIRTGEPDSLAA
jgi:hypothetical protein